MPNSAEQILHLRNLVKKMDEYIYPLIQLIVENNKIPIIIGGGHNNAFPCIKGSTFGLRAIHKNKKIKINVINIDAHADLRPLEGRHSGNAFSYANKDGYLNKYVVVGIEPYYLTQYMIDQFNKNNNFTYIECGQIKASPNYPLIDFNVHAFTDYVGVELDLDAIENIQSSAESPTGFTTAEVRTFIKKIASYKKNTYFHICEGAFKKTDNEFFNNTIGKLISIFVLDFITSNRKMG